MKLFRLTYITLFIFLGIILQFLIHGVVEVLYIKLLNSNFARYGFGLSWDAWFLIHHIASLILLLAGALWGYLMGRYWHKKLYGSEAVH